jgi:hypothetical protein
MTRLVVAVIPLAVLLACVAACPAAVEVTHKEGACKLQKAGAFDDAKLFKITVGKHVRLTTRWRIDEFFGKTIINANVTVKNPTTKPLHYEYYVAFFDKEGTLVGCTGQGVMEDEGLKPGEEERLGSCLVTLPPARAQAVATYRLVLYESDKPIGK